MPLGSALTSVIDIDFTRAQGESSTGRITFKPTRIRVGTTIVSSFPVVVPIVNGVAKIALARLPFGLYNVTEEIDGRPQFRFRMALPNEAADVIEYETIAHVDSVPAVYTSVKTVNGVGPDPVTGNVIVPAGVGPKGDKGDDGADGTNGTNGLNGIDGTDGVDGQDGTMKGKVSTGLILGTFGPAGGSGPWVLCPPAYRLSIAAAIGDLLLWTPGFLHQSGQEAAYDLASVVAGEAVRHRSSGTDTPGAFGYGGLYLAPDYVRALRSVMWTVAAEDIEDGMVTLALVYRDSGSGNVMGHAAVSGDIVVVNLGQ